MTALHDHDHRTRIANNLDETLFVQASAGSGKTTALVARLVRYIATGRLKSQQLAAITFSEAAAAELRERIRSQLRAAADELDEPVQRQRCRDALHNLDRAAITTLHGFALSILREFPIEAGLPPIVEPLDDVTSIVAFDARWQRWLATVDQDPQLVTALGRLAALDVKLPRVRELAVILNQNWDRLVPFDQQLLRIRNETLVQTRRQLTDVLTHCTDDSDLLFKRLTVEIAKINPLIELASESEDDQTVLLAGMSSIQSPRVGNLGRAGSWRMPKGEVLGLVAQAYEGFADFKSDVITNLLMVTASKLTDAVLAQADARRRAGQLEFHDLLVRSVQLLRKDARVRATLHDRYRVVLLDEFQDTDPLQIDLAVLIAGDTSEWDASDPPPWYDIPVAAGRMFFVGDAKQSIYRFRRADIELFAHVGRQFQSEPVELSQNFRSVPEIIDWVNATFGALMSEGVGSAQPPYVPLVAARESHSMSAVHRFGVEHPSGTSANDVRRAEASELAQIIGRCLSEQWPVFVGGQWRPARLSDIAILIPARTSLRQLEAALDAAAIPYRVETSTLIYGTQEVHDLMMTLHALDDPNNDVSIVAALRSAAFSCADDDLIAWAEANHTWNYTTAPAESSPATVLEAMAWLNAASKVARSAPIAETIERVIRERSLIPLTSVSPRPRDAWRRLRFVHDQARVFGQQKGSTLRHYLRWVDLQRRGDARVREVIVPESDIDAVRILTMHGSKGLEFPVACLSGLSTRPPALTSHVQVMWPEESTELVVRLKADVSTRSYDEANALEEQMDDDERLRLLYVAATRARDHLIVSTHYVGQKSRPKRFPFGRLLAEQMDEQSSRDVMNHSARASDEDSCQAIRPDLPVDRLERAEDRSLRAVDRDGDPADEDDPDKLPDVTAPALAAAAAERQSVQQAMARRRSQDDSVKIIAATSVAEALGVVAPWSSPAASSSEADEHLIDAELAPGLDTRPPRNGAAIGRAVHSVLQLAPISDAPPQVIEQLVVAQANSEGIGDCAPEVLRLVSHVRASPVYKLAAGHPHWRELYVGVDIEGTLLEGYVDLLIESPDGLVIVDYKTDAVSGPGGVHPLAMKYRYQAATYALAVERTVNRPVQRAVLVFANADKPLEVDVPDLAVARADIEARLRPPTSS